jgi:hypothetical protein
VHTLPGARLRVPWREVKAYDTLMVNWRRVSDEPLTTSNKDPPMPDTGRR